MMGLRNRLAAFDPNKLLLACGLGLAAGYAGGLIKQALTGMLILDLHGRPVLSDFVALWAAGRQALAGSGVAAYDLRLEHAAEVAAVGHSFHFGLGWAYPPPFLFIVAALACIPYAYAFVLWDIATLLLHAIVTARTAARRLAALYACAAPWVLTGLMSGQTGFLTASLVGLTLLWLPKRPVMSGLALGLLSYKPQFGILFPLALACGGYWRTFAWAVASTVVLNGLSLAAFGEQTFWAFLGSLSNAAHSHLISAGVGWNNLESIYGLVRALNGSNNAAWLAQGAVSIFVAVAVMEVWRSEIPFTIKGALLAVAIPLATPYVFTYDLAVLSVACASVFRHREFDRLELVILMLTVPLVFAVPSATLPTGLFACLAIGFIVLRRARQEQKGNLQTAGSEVPSVPLMVLPAMGD